MKKVNTLKQQEFYHRLDHMEYGKYDKLSFSVWLAVLSLHLLSITVDILSDTSRCFHLVMRINGQ